MRAGTHSGNHLADPIACCAENSAPAINCPGNHRMHDFPSSVILYWL